MNVPVGLDFGFDLESGDSQQTKQQSRNGEEGAILVYEYITSWHEKGREEERVAVARRLIDMELSDEQIERATELSRDIIESLRSEDREG